MMMHKEKMKERIPYNANSFHHWLDEQEMANNKKQQKNPPTISQGIEPTNKIQYLSEDLLFNIFIRLPIDSLRNLRQVCKVWYKMTHDPFFIIQLGNGLIIQETISDKERELRTHFVAMREELNTIGALKLQCTEQIIASCNGLILVKHKPEYGDLSVANLLTKKWMTLPPRNFPLKDNFWCGFSLVPSTGEYKVVIFFVCKDVLRGEILTLGSNTWRKIYSIPNAIGKWLSSNPISVNGFSHLCTPALNHVFAMDMADEKFHQCRLPISRHRTDQFMEMGGFFSLVSYETPTTQLDIWILKDFCRGEWLKQHSISLASVRQIIQEESFKGFHHIGSLKNGKVIIFRRQSSMSGCRYFAYHIDLKEMRPTSLKIQNPCYAMTHIHSVAAW